MKFKRSPKVYQNYKCDNPKNTIRKIDSGFRRVGLAVVYRCKEIKLKNLNYFTGSVRLPYLNLTSNGKGWNYYLSKASACGEAVERFSAEMHSPASYLFMKSIIKNFWADDIKYYSSFYFKSFTKNKGNSNKASYTNDKVTNNWLREIKKQMNSVRRNSKNVYAFSLIHKKYIRIPATKVKLLSFSNGLAAGNTLEEAIVQGANEIFERYILARVINNKKKIWPTIDKTSIKSKRIINFIKLFESNNFDIILKDFSLNGEFPCYGVLFVNNNLKNTKNKIKKRYFFRRVRIASDFNPEIAILRCFMEELQGKDLKDLKKHKYLDSIWELGLKENLKFVFNTDLSNLRYYHYPKSLRHLEEGKIEKFDHLKNKKFSDFYDELEEIKKIIEKQKRDILIIDYTHPKIRFPVVRVIIPGMSDMVNLFSSIRLTKASDEEIYSLMYPYFKYMKRFILNNMWVKSQEGVKEFVEALRSYISNYPLMEEIPTPVFPLKENSVYMLMLFSYLRIRKYESALNYLKTIIKIYPKNKKLFDKLYRYLKSVKKDNINYERIKVMVKDLPFQEKVILLEPHRNPLDPNFFLSKENEFFTKLVLIRAMKSFEGS
ncbi:MAG: YcaO-like family protein [Candidatus Aenigmatarchaeota archaeon]